MAMKTEVSLLESLVQQILAAIQEPLDPAAEASSDLSMRERFMELLVLALANLYGKTPVPASPFDRAMMRSITKGMDDNDAGKFTTRSDDWIRLEGIVRVQEGAKNYVLNRMALAVLSSPTSQGTLGEVMEGIASVYSNPGPTPQLRLITRQLGAYFMTRLGRSA
jgi:hypothetical protein